jgi:hypothetical protein
MFSVPVPDMMPVLSRGKHRSPRKGACFMELASYLAGERWSDHPGCTHPLLAALARDVNDHLDDDARRRIAPLIPQVIGLNRRDPVVEIRLTREVALTALPIVSAPRQGVVAVGLLGCEKALNDLLRLSPDHLSPQAVAALALVPEAHRWADDFCRMGWGRLDRFSSRSAPAIIHGAVTGIAEAAVSDPQAVLVDLLTRVVGRCRTWMEADEPEMDDARWGELHALTHR